MQTISNLFIFLLINSAWQITAITLVALLCDRLLRNTSARLRHILWVAALMLAVILPVLSGVDLKTISNGSMSAADPASVIVRDPETKARELVETAIEARSTIAVGETAVLIMLAVYAVVVGYRVFRLFKGFRQMRSIRQGWFAGDWGKTDAALIDDCKRASGVKNVEIFSSSTVASPITLGALRPAIVLPERLLGGVDHDVLVSAVLHELNHVRRHDYLLNLLYELIFLPISFHPAATLVKRRIRETRELACDEHVTETMVAPAVYARSLVSIADLAMDLGRGTNMTIGILDDGALEKRIMKILNRTKLNSYRKSFLLVSASLVFALAIAATMSFTLRPVVAQQADSAELAAKKKAEEESRLTMIADKMKKNLYEVQRDENPPRDMEEVLVAAKREAELKAMIIDHSDLAKRANISMAQAITIATNEQPGTVMETKIVFERNGGETEEPFYVVTIVAEKDGAKFEKRIIVSGIDGSIGGPHNN